MGQDDTYLVTGVKDNLQPRLNKVSQIGYLLNHVRPHDRIVWVAGGALLRAEPNDIDIYAKPAFNATTFGSISSAMTDQPKRWHGVEIRLTTVNAMTLMVEGRKTQLCTMEAPTLMDLISSFDFSHCQIGAEVYLPTLSIRSIQYTPAFIDFALSQTTVYRSSPNPFGSLLRSYKYVTRGHFTKKSWEESILAIVEDIVRTGLQNPGIFMLPGISEESEAGGSRQLQELFTTLSRGYTMSLLSKP